MTVITFEGHKISTRTRDMLIEARRITKAALFITQGGYNAGGVKASAGTHDRDALDIRAKDLTTAQRAEAVLRLRQVGFAAWVRNPSQSDWPWHIHCIPIGGDISAGAAKQVTAYKNNRNGLASNGHDDGPRLYIQTWEQYLKKRGPLPVQPEEDEMTPAQMTELKAYFEARLKAYTTFIVANREQTTERDLDKILAELAEIEQEVKD